jgi:hypothetical protein
MNIKELFQHIASHLRQEHRQVSYEAVQRFLRILEEVRVDEMPCSQVYARLDEYVEKEMHGEDATLLMPLLKEHLDLCPDCCDEYESLLNVMEESSRRT